MAGSATTYRFGTTAANISYFAAGPYEIRAYTDNNISTGDVRGSIQSAAGDKLYPKIWCPNFSGNALISDTAGPSFSTTSSETQYVWGGYDLNGDDIFDPNDPQTHTTDTFDEAALGQDINGDGDIEDEIDASTLENGLSEGPSLSYLRELDSHTEGDTAGAAETRCVLAWNTTGRGDGSLNNPFPVTLAADVNGVTNATYSSANNVVPGVFFELFIY